MNRWSPPFGRPSAYRQKKFAVGFKNFGRWSTKNVSIPKFQPIPIHEIFCQPILEFSNYLQ